MLYSSNDIMFTLEDGLELKPYFTTNVSITGLPNCGHFPHL